jgi:uncharacterized membrane protein (DUF106 family)
MKSTVLRYGIYAMLAMVLLSAVHVFLVVPNFKSANAQVVGYLTMLLSMIFVFAGIKHYRDKANNGVLSFWQGLRIGVLIVLIPSIAFGLFDLLYTKVINPGWMENYYKEMIEQTKKVTTPDKLDAALKKLESSKEIFSNPFLEFLLMAVTVFIIGFVVTIISSLTLRRSRSAAALS